jgi:hypothetical protein
MDYSTTLVHSQMLLGLQSIIFVITYFEKVF